MGPPATASACRGRVARVAPLLKISGKKGLIGLKEQMIEELAAATEEGDEDRLEELIIAAWVKHIDSCSKGGEWGSGARLLGGGEGRERGQCEAQRQTWYTSQLSQVIHLK
jgi:hypothetical protein